MSVEAQAGFDSPGSYQVLQKESKVEIQRTEFDQIQIFFAIFE